MFDYEKRETEFLLERDLPFAFIIGVVIQGDIVLTQLPHEYGAILVNWRTGESVLVDFSDSSVSTQMSYR